MNSKKYSTILSIAFISLGFSSMISQIVFIRELITLFMGNELTLGIILALWLLWTATGSGLFGLFTKYLKNPFRLLYFLQFVIVLLLPLTIIFIRLSRNIFSLLPGEVTSPFFIFFIPFIVLAPIGTLFGFFFYIKLQGSLKN